MTEPTPVTLGRQVGSVEPGPSAPSTPPGLSDTTVEAGLEIQVRSQWDYARSRFLRHRLAMAGLIGLIILFGAGIFANFIAPYSYEQLDLNNILAPPTLAGHHFFGTDEIGRDYFSRVIWGIRTSEEVGVLVAVMSTFIGLVIGAIAGFYGGWGDNLLMRFTDLVLTLPFLAILLTAAALLGQGSQWRVTFILALLFWTTNRTRRPRHLPLAAREGVRRGRQGGRRGRRADHVPAHPPEHAGAGRREHDARRGDRDPDRGGALVPRLRHQAADAVARRARGQGGQTNPQQWWLTVFPGLTLVLIVLCVNFVGDGLRDALDPTQRRVRA